MRPNADERWTNYVITPTGCWDWQGYVASNGYGRVYDRSRPRGKQIQWVHRAFYERLRDPIPVGLELDHTCCNTICVNPDHLDLVTRAEHIRRTLARLGRDEKHERAAVLRALGMTYAEIAQALGYTSKTGAHGAVLAAIEKGLVAADSVPQMSLTEAQRADIRDLRDLGIPHSEVAAWYGVSESHVSRITRQQARPGAA